MNPPISILHLYRSLDHEEKQRLALMMMLVQLSSAKQVFGNDLAFTGLLRYAQHTCTIKEGTRLANFLARIEKIVV